MRFSIAAQTAAVAMLALVVLPAHASTKQELETKAKLDFTAYKSCMEEAAASYISSEASPSEIADAAQSRCNNQFYSYQRSVEDYFASLVSRSRRSTAQRNAEEHVASSKSTLRDRVIQLVVEGRLAN